MSELPLLTKSSLLRGAQCQKRLALDALHPELRDPLERVDRMRMRLGQQVGLEARKRYPGGAVGRIPGPFADSAQRTRGLMATGTPVVYEASMQAQGLRIVADILQRLEDGWRLIEVKSTTQAKPHHIWDVAVQVDVLRRSGLDIQDAVLLHLNRDYVRQGKLDYQELFAETSLLEEAEAIQEWVANQINISRATLASGKVPDIPIGPYCHDPVDCEFIGHCWRDVPSPSVFDVYYIGKKAHQLYAQGVERIEDISDSHRLDERSKFHVQAHKSGRTIVKPNRIQAFLRSLEYPLHYLDFETFAHPIPPYDGLRPYDKVPFQYSLHIQREPGGELAHSGFLAGEGVDPRRALLTRLLRETQGSGSVVVYYSAFERGVLAELADRFPEHREAILDRIGRIVDLILPFRRRFYWTPEMGGSNSLKDVLAAFAPDLSYEQVGIGDGEEAMAVFLHLAEEGDPERVQELRQMLWDYCKLDTLAMARVLEGLREAAGL